MLKVCGYVLLQIHGTSGQEYGAMEGAFSRSTSVQVSFRTTTWDGEKGGRVLEEQSGRLIMLRKGGARAEVKGSRLGKDRSWVAVYDGGRFRWRGGFDGSDAEDGVNFERLWSNVVLSFVRVGLSESLTFFPGYNLTSQAPGAQPEKAMVIESLSGVDGPDNPVKRGGGLKWVVAVEGRPWKAQVKVTRSEDSGLPISRTVVFEREGGKYTTEETYESVLLDQMVDGGLFKL